MNRCKKKGITFETFALYFQKQNDIFEQVGKRIIDMTRAPIFEKNSDDDLQPKLIFAITYVKDNQPIKALQNNFCFYKVYTHKFPNLSHFQIFGPTVYVFLYKEKQTLKSKNCSPTALKDPLVGYDSHTIYCMYFKDQKKII